MSDISQRIAGLSPEKRAILARRLQEKSGSAPASVEPLAIIGMGCRFPGDAASPEAYWRQLLEGIDAISEVPAERWSVDEFFDPDPSAAGKISTRNGGFLQRVDEFDAQLFGISPREAMQMDPQQRLLLEVAWQALENAGQPPERLRGSRTGVFVGAHSHSSDYCWLQFAQPEALDAFSGTGTAHNFLSGRLSYLFDLHGPSLVVDTACSSSLVAVHLACQSLRAGECTMAIVGGVNVILSPWFSVAASRMNMLAPDGRCKTFDASADGFTRGEGCGVVVIKRLKDALAAGDPVLAVVRGTAINQDGHTNGITAPNGLSQQAVIRQALHAGGVEPVDVGYVETHGTGTPLGDPIEVEALATVFGGSKDRSPLWLGSAKSSIGHLEGAAGIAGLIKAVLTVREGRITPVVHFKRLNPHIRLEGSPLQIPDAQIEWKTDGPRRAGVSSFGWSGTNAHVVLEQAPPVERPTREPRDIELVVPLSAHTPESLAALVDDWVGRLREDAMGDMADVAATAALRRPHHPHRLGVVARSAQEMLVRLEAYQRGEQPQGVAAGYAPAERKSIVFLFPGQGSQWLGMGRDLLAAEPVFRQSIERTAAALAAYVDWSLVEQLAADPERSRLQEIDVVQPTLFAIQVALADLWRSWGVEPDAVVGHSMGEVAAACVAGTLSLDDAARVICRRSRLLKRISGKGAMAVVELSLSDTAAAIAGREHQLSIAVSNSPRSTVISGDVAAVEAVIASLQARDVFCRSVKVDVASHSPQVDELTADLLRALEGLRPSSSQVPIYSTVTGTVTDGREFDASYWVKNLRQPVLLSAVVQQLAGDGITSFVEVSPHPILLPAVENGLQHFGAVGQTVPSLRREEPETLVMRSSLLALYVNGQPLDWSVLAAGGAFTPLPATPLHRERFWLPAIDAARRTVAHVHGHPFVGHAARSTDGRVNWTPLSIDSPVSGLPECHLLGASVLAAGVLVEAAAEAAREVEAAAVSGLELQRPIRLADSRTSLSVRAEAQPESSDTYGFRVLSRTDDGPWTTHATAQLSDRPDAIDWEDVSTIAEAGEPIRGEDIYARLAEAGWETPAGMRALGDGRAVGDYLSVRLSSVASGRGTAGFSPALAQACLDLASFAAMRRQSAAEGGLYLPFRVAHVRRAVNGGNPGWVIARPSARHEGTSDVIVLDESSAAVAWLRGVECLEFAEDARDLAVQRLDDWLHELRWEPLAPLSPAPGRNGLWIVVADRSGVGDALAKRLSTAGRSVTVVPASEASGVRGAIDDALRSSGGTCLGVIDLTSLDLPDIAAVDQPTRERLLVDSSGTAVAAVRALLDQTFTVSPRIFLVTRGAQAIGDAVGSGGLLQAPVWGLGRVIAEEHPDLWGGLIDLDPADPADVAAARLQAQIEAGDGERQVALRQDVRYGARFAPFDAAAPAMPLRLRPDASYLITGGLNGVGLAVAGWLAEQGARHLVLIGRTPLPPRREWAVVDRESPAGRRVAAVEDLERRGVTVHTPALDVADAASLSAFLSEYRAERRPPIRGVIHSAVVIEDALVKDQTPAMVANVFRPKVSGSWALHECTAGDPLDFFVLFSSLGAVLGQAGQGAYAAANAFLDALAIHRRRQKMPGLSINWAGWREAGLGAASAGARLTIQSLAHEGIASYTTAQGLDVLGRLLQGAPAQAVVMPLSGRFQTSHWVAADPQAFALLTARAREAAPSAPASRRTFRQQLADMEPAERKQAFEQFLCEQLAQVMRLPVARIDPQRPLGAMGLESLLALEFRNRLEPHLGMKLSATLVWNHPTVVALARHLAERMDLAYETSQPAEAASEPVAVTSSELDDLSELEALRALTGGAGEA